MKKITLLFLILSFLESAAQIIVKDIKPTTSSSPNSFKVCNSKLLFTSLDKNLVGGELELWSTDGTANGTVIVKEINPTKGAISSSFADLYLIGKNVYFRADDGVHGQELWKSDGTAEGTVMVKDINPSARGLGPDHFVVINNILYFSAENGVHGREPWKSDGTLEGTIMIKDVRVGQYGSIKSNSKLSTFTAVGDNFYFSGWDGSSMGEELWKSNGTGAGTIMVKNLNEQYQSGVYPINLVAFGNKIIFRGTDYLYGEEVFISDGTEQGTKLLKDINPGGYNSAPVSFTVSNGLVFFSATDGLSGYELWKTDGTTAGTIRVKDINLGSGWGVGEQYSKTYDMIDFNGLVYFNGNDGVHGGELWKSDGTAAGTVMVLDGIAGTTGIKPDGYAVIGNNIYFSGSSNGIDREFWKSDGTMAGTKLIMDIWTGNQSSNPDNFTLFNNAVYFAAETFSSGRELWKYDIGALGLEEFTLAGTKIYPNPINTVLNIENTVGEKIKQVSVYNSLGQVVHRVSDVSLGNTLSINVSKLQSGIYLAEIISQNGRVVKKVIKN